MVCCSCKIKKEPLNKLAVKIQCFSADDKWIHPGQLWIWHFSPESNTQSGHSSVFNPNHHRWDKLDHSWAGFKLHPKAFPKEQKKPPTTKRQLRQGTKSSFAIIPADRMMPVQPTSADGSANNFYESLSYFNLPTVMCKTLCITNPGSPRINVCCHYSAWVLLLLCQLYVCAHKE